jgi:glucosylceramidase
MKFHASPWSPPGWMKTNGRQTNGGELLSDDRTLQTHANYLVKFLQAYQSHQIFINRLCPQNEPLVAGNYPGCKIPAPLFAKSIKEFILPALKKSELKTEVLAGTFNYWRQDTRGHFEDILNDKELAKSVDGFSFQYSNIGWMKEFLAKYPKVKIQHSESECYNGANSKEEAYRDFQDFVAYTRVGSRLFTFWNMVLPEPHASTWGWKQNSLVVIDKSKQTVWYQPSFALAKLLGRHVVPRSHYLSSNITKGEESIGALHYEPRDCVKFMQTGLDRGEQVISFRKPDGSTAVLVLNQGDEVNVEIKMNKRKAVVTLPAQTLAAVTLK